MIKGSIHGEDVILVNIYASKYIKQILTDIKGEIDGNTVRGHFNIPFTTMDRSWRQKIKQKRSYIIQ